MKIKQFKHSHDNFGYILYGKKEAVVIDGGDAKGILQFIHKHDLNLSVVTNTHSHYDHTSGNNTLLRETEASFFDTKTLKKMSSISLEENQLEILHTPGHTDDSFTFFTGTALITGDTLFNGTVGNCFSGNMRAFLKSILLLMEFAPATVIYAGHDYVRDSMTYAKIIEPYNGVNIAAYLSKYSPEHVKSTIADETQANPYVRFDNDHMIENLKNRTLPHGTELERWESVMSIG